MPAVEKPAVRLTGTTAACCFAFMVKAMLQLIQKLRGGCNLGDNFHAILSEQLGTLSALLFSPALGDKAAGYIFSQRNDECPM